MLTSAPLDSMDTWTGLRPTGDPGYKLAFMACDFFAAPLVPRPSVVRSLASFWDAIGNGRSWQDAFQATFGTTTQDFYAQFEQNRSRLFPPAATLPYSIAFDGSFPPGTDVGHGSLADQVPYFFRVLGFDLSTLRTDQLEVAFKRPQGSSSSLTRLGRDLLVLYMKTELKSGDYSVALDLPDGRHSETTFNHVATSGADIANPLPSITSLFPNLGLAGDAGFILSINGRDFVNGALVFLNDSKRIPKLRSSTELEFALTGSDIAAAGAIRINVSNPGPGGGTSNTQTLTLTQSGAKPVITGASISGKKLIVSGRGFDEGAKILLGGEQQKTANDESNPATILIGKKAGKFIAPGQTVVVTVRNSDGSMSNGVQLHSTSERPMIPLSVTAMVFLCLSFPRRLRIGVQLLLASPYIPRIPAMN